MSDTVYYRPPWTCGKYNAEKHVAIMFNLLSHSEYLFEAESADVIGYVLQVGRGGAAEVNKVSNVLNITPESIIPFFSSLVECGLLTETFPTKEFTQKYRDQCAQIKNETTFLGEKTDGYTMVDGSQVERAYADRVMECTKINSVMFELTYRCSERCLHCYNPGAIRNDCEENGRGRCVEMTVDNYKRIIDEMCDAGLVTASITGGDPFSNKDVWDILEYLYQKDIAVTVFTNGLHLYKHIDRLANLFPRDVRCSLYSANASDHDYITRVNGSWKRTVDVIAALRKQAIPVRINCVVMRPCLQSFLGLKAFGEKYNCSVVFDVGVFDSMDGDTCATENLRLTQDELDVVLMDGDVEERTEENDLYKTPVPVNGPPCLAGIGTYCVTPDGMLVPCVAFRMALGDLKKQSFLSIVSNNQLMQDWFNSKPDDYEECWTHEYCSYCNFCVGNNYREHGNIFKASENNCYTAKARYKVAKKLKAKSLLLDEDEIRNRIDALPKYDKKVLHRHFKQNG